MLLLVIGADIEARNEVSCCLHLLRWYLSAIEVHYTYTTYVFRCGLAINLVPLTFTPLLLEPYLLMENGVLACRSTEGIFISRMLYVC